MAIDLMALEPQQISRDLRGKFGMIYGQAGVGKTTLGSMFPKALIVGFEQGTNALHNIYVQPAKTWNDWKQIANQLLKKPELKEKFNTIVIDTADEAHKLAEKWLCQQYGVESIREVAGYGQGYSMLDDIFMTPFRDLTFAGYGLLFISHGKEKPEPTAKNPDHVKVYPALASRPFNLINKMVDYVGYIKAEHNEDGSDKRYIYFRESEDYMAKCRFKYIAPRVEFSYDSIVNAIYEAIDKEVADKGGTSTEEVNPYTQQSFDDLIEEARGLWGQVIQKEVIADANKILEEEFGQPIKFSQIMPEQIEHLKNVLLKIKEIL